MHQRGIGSLRRRREGVKLLSRKSLCRLSDYKSYRLAVCSPESSGEYRAHLLAASPGDNYKLVDINICDTNY